MKSKYLISIVILVIVLAVLVMVFVNKPQLSESEALDLANQAVSEYDISFSEMIKDSAETSKHVASFIEECDFSDYKYDEVWVAQKDVGEKEIDGENYNVIIFVHVGLDSRVCKSAQLEEVIPGIISVDEVFG